MSPIDVMEGVVRVGFEDREVLTGLDALVAKTKADLAAIGREKAVVNVKYNVQDAKLALAEAKAAEKALADEIRKREKALKNADATRKGGLTAALNARRAEQQALEGETKVMRQHVKVLEERLRTGQRVIEQERIGARERAISDRAQIDAAKEKARYDREHAAALKENERYDARASTTALRALERDAKKIALQERQLALQQRIAELEKAAGRAQGTDRMRIGLEGGRAVAEMAKLHEELRLMGAKPIIQKVEVDRSALSKLGDLFGFGKRDQIKDLHTRLFEVAKGAKDARIQLGFMSTTLQGLVVGGAALAPVITGLVGALGSLISSVGAGLGGALGIGAAGMTGFGLATVGMLSTIKPFMQQLGFAHAWLLRLNAQIAKYGANSKQGIRAQQQFNREIASLPPTVREAVKGYHALLTEWQKLTQSNANRQIGNIIGATFKTVKADMKFFAKDTNQAFANVAAGWSGLMKQFRTRDAQRGIDTIFQNFNKTIPTTFDALTHLADAAGRIIQNFSKYLPGLATGFDDWAKRVDDAAKKTGGFAKSVDIMVTSFKDVTRFIGAATRFLFEFFRAGVKPGNGLVNDMTKSLNRLSNQMATVSGQKRLTDFFQRSIVTTKALWSALLPLLSAFVQFSQVTAPIANIMLRIVSALTKGIAVLVAFKPLQWAAGILLAVSVVGRLSSGLWEAGKATVGLGRRLWEVMRLIGAGGGIRDSFKSVFSGGEGIGASIVASSREGAAMYEGAIVAGSTRGAAEIAAAMEAAGVTAATEIGAAETAGGAVGGLGAAGAGAVGAAGGGGFLSALKGVGLKGLLRFLGIAGLGIGASQLIGGAVGGTGGGAIKTIGGFAAGGAAIGSVVPGIGTVAGGVVGAVGGGLVEAFKLFNARHAHDLGKEMADKYTAPLGPALKVATGQATDPTLQKLGRKAVDDSNKVVPKGAFGDPTKVPASVAQPQWDKFGKRAGEDFAKAFATARVPTQFIFIQDVLDQMQKLDPRARAAAAMVAVNFAHGMVEKGQMTKAAFAGLIASLEAQIPGLETKLRKAGMDSSSQFARAMNFGQAKLKLADMVTQYSAAMVDTRISTKLTADNIVQNMNTAMQDLQAAMHSGPKKGRAKARAELQLMRRQFASIMDGAIGDMASKAKQMQNILGKHSRDARNAVNRNFLNMAGIIGGAMQSGLISVKDGVNKIGEALNHTLNALGQAKLKGLTLSVATTKVLIGSGISGAISNPFGIPTNATGGRVPGPVGPDNWTLVDASGRARGKVGGAELLIANRHTEEAASVATSMVYGKTLGEMVSNETRPHSAPRRFAAGGVVTASQFGGPSDPKTGSTGYRGDNLYQKPDSYAELNMGTALGHLPYMTPLTVTHGQKTARLFKRDIGAGGPGLNGHTRAIDIWFQAAGPLGIGGLSDVTVNSGAGVNLRISGGTGMAQQLRAPRVSGGGAVGRIADAVLARVTKGANKYLDAHQPAVNVGVGGYTGGGHAYKKGALTFPLPSGSWSPGSIDQGWDLTAGAHTPLLAVGNGVIANHGISGFGPWAPILQLDNGDSVYYGHAGPGNWSPIGRHVRAGQVISEVGAGKIGISTGPHLEIGWYPVGSRSGASMKSALGYATGGRVSYAGAFANGGMFTANRPTLGLFGENGPETVMAIPHAQTGGRFSADAAKKGKKPTSSHPHRTTPQPHWPHIDKYVFSLSPKDRIGGVGTDDIDAAVTAMKSAISTFERKIGGQTHKVTVPTSNTSSHRTRHVDSHGRVTYSNTTTTSHGHHTQVVKSGPTPHQKDQLHRMRTRLHNLQRLDTSAKKKISAFADLETLISNVDNYMTAAGNDPTDQSGGFDPTSGKWIVKSWSEWQKDLVRLEKNHTNKLRDAAIEVTRLVGKDRSATALNYVRTLQGAYGQALIDQQGAETATDPNAPTTTFGTAASADDYLSLLPKSFSDQLAKLNYAFALAQTNNAPDDPGTPQREDLQALGDDLLWATGLKDFYGNLFKRAQADPRTGTNYPLLTSLADAFTGAQGTWQGIQDQFTQATTAGGPTQPQTFTSAAEALLDQYASNVSPVPVGSNSPPTIPGMTPGGQAPQKNVTIHQYFPVHPDPHSWSKGIGWELEHAL